LRLEKVTNKTFPANKKYQMVKRNGKSYKEYSETYAKAYHTALKGMVQRRMLSSILEAGSFWFSAWVDAGQPDLNKLIAKPLPSREKRNLDHEAILYKQGKILTTDR
jgi:hypothetical protein